MFKTYFYHETIKRSRISIFTLFNNLDYKKTKEDVITVLNRYKVPISYNPAQKYLQRLIEEPNLNDNRRDNNIIASYNI